MQRTTLMLMISCLTSAAMAQQPETAHPAGEKTPEGMMVPMMTDAHMRSRTPMGQGELVFNKTDHGFYFFDGTDWRPLLRAEPAPDGKALHWVQQRPGSETGGNGMLKLSLGTSGFWDLTGNAATDPATDFIGTTDAQPLRFRVNNAFSGQIGAQTNALLSLGVLAGAANTTGTNNTFIGAQAGLNTTSGSGNTAIGNGAGKANTTGQSSVFVGNGAGLNSTGSFNCFLGSNTGVGVTTGANNTFVGHNSGAATTIGAGNVCLGANAGQTAVLGSNNTLLGTNTDIFLSGITNATAIGDRATVSASNSVVLGSVAGSNGATSTVNVGIGVIAPADRLHVVGNIRMVDGNQSAGKVLTSDANGRASWQALPAGTIDWGLSGNAGTNPNTNFIGTTDATDLRIRTANAERITVTSAGKVGIGTSTAINTRLLVAGGISTSPSNTFTLVAGTNTITVGDRSFLRLTTTTTSSLVLTDGLNAGQMLFVEHVGTSGSISVTDLTSNCNLQANRSMGPSDMLTLLWDGVDWIEVNFANN